MRSFIVLICLFAFSTAFALQGAETPGPKTLNDQYRALSVDCEVINGVRMMKLFKMDLFWKSVKDSVNGKKVTIANLNVVTVQQSSEINQLKGLLAKSEAEKAELALKVDNINVFGSYYSKQGFITFASVVVVGLLLVSVVFALLYKFSFGSTNELKKNNEILYHEYEDYKHKAVEKEVKILRELQNYRNRMTDLRSA